MGATAAALCAVSPFDEQPLAVSRRRTTSAAERAESVWARPIRSPSDRAQRTFTAVLGYAGRDAVKLASLRGSRSGGPWPKHTRAGSSAATLRIDSRLRAGSGVK